MEPLVGAGLSQSEPGIDSSQTQREIYSGGWYWNRPRKNPNYKGEGDGQKKEEGRRHLFC